MASIRRTLSPVPRPGTLPKGEACSVASPLSKSSSCIQNYPPPPPPPPNSFDHPLYRVQAFILSFFSKRYSWALERPKSKGQVWRRSLLYFFICFMVGVLFGLTPFVSMNLSLNLMSTHQSFSFEMVPPLEEVQLPDVVPRNVTLLAESSAVNDNARLGSHEMTLEPQNGTSDDTLVTQSRNQDFNITFHKLLIIVTPIFAQPLQAYYLNRLALTLKLIPPPLLWIVVEMGSQSAETAGILRRNGVMYRHLVCNKNLTDLKDRSVHQRNVALSHIETHHLDGIVYFVDGDKVYSVDLFEQMRQIRRFGTWIVAKLMGSDGRAILEGPVCNGTQVIGWHTKEVTGRFRRFHAEMSGFAFNSTILWDPKRWHRPTLEHIRQLDTVSGGLRVSTFIEQVVEDESQMECLPLDHSRLMVWQLHVEASYSYPSEWLMKNNNPDVIPPLA